MTETPLNTYRSHEQRSNDTSRRTILKGAAWSVPVLTIATAAPAAASGLCEGAFTFLPNPIVLNPYDATGYWTPITITHSGPAPIAVVNVVVTGANISLTTGGTTGTVTLSGGTGLVNIVTKPGAAGGHAQHIYRRPGPSMPCHNRADYGVPRSAERRIEFRYRWPEPRESRTSRSDSPSDRTA